MQATFYYSNGMLRRYTYPESVRRIGLTIGNKWNRPESVEFTNVPTLEEMSSEERKDKLKWVGFCILACYVKTTKPEPEFDEERQEIPNLPIYCTGCNSPDYKIIRTPSEGITKFICSECSYVFLELPLKEESQPEFVKTSVEAEMGSWSPEISGENLEVTLSDGSKTYIQGGRMKVEPQPIKVGKATVDILHKSIKLGPLAEALCGSRGADQQRIAEAGVKWIETIIKKNLDYGSSAWKKPILSPDLPAKEAILVRMSDKIERLIRLHHKKGEVEETYEDTMADLGSYALLYLTCPEEGEDDRIDREVDIEVKRKEGRPPWHE